MAMNPNALVANLKALESGGQGLAFGVGYGTGVRLGYEDVYPLVKGRLDKISQLLDIPFVGSGIKSGSGAIQPQPLKLPFGLSP